MDIVKEAKPRMGAIASEKSADKSKHYCYSVDLRSVKNLNIEHTIKCFCRYEIFSFFSSPMYLISLFQSACEV